MLGLLDKPVEFRGARSDRVVVPHLAYISPSIDICKVPGEFTFVTVPARDALRSRGGVGLFTVAPRKIGGPDPLPLGRSDYMIERRTTVKRGAYQRSLVNHFGILTAKLQ